MAANSPEQLLHAILRHLMLREGWVKQIVVLGLAAIGLAGCVSTSEMQVAPNAYRIDTNASGLLFVGQAGKQTLKRAAELTIQKGYSHFKIVGSDYDTGSAIVGVTPGPSYGNVHVVGSYAYVNTYSGPSTVQRAPTEKASAIIVMFNSSDPEAAGAFDAEQVLKEASTQ